MQPKISAGSATVGGRAACGGGMQDKTTENAASLCGISTAAR
ncbi:MULTISPECIES: hypothetical protein [unclassified Duganella]|nr:MULTISPECIES: hypothetical protein [unclassified Duganella]